MLFVTRKWPVANKNAISLRDEEAASFSENLYLLQRRWAKG